MSAAPAGAVTEDQVAELVDDIDGFAADTASMARSWQAISDETNRMASDVASLPQVLSGPLLQPAFAELMTPPKQLAAQLDDAARQYAQLGQWAASEFGTISRDRARLIADITEFHLEVPMIVAQIATLTISALEPSAPAGEPIWRQSPELVQRDDDLRLRVARFNANLEATLDQLASRIANIMVSPFGLLPELTPAGLLTAGVSPAAVATITHGGVEAIFVGLDDQELDSALRGNPALRDWVKTLSAQDAADWWTRLDPSRQNALIQTIPSIIGSLDGIPADGRVRANRINAERFIPTIDSRIANLERKIHGHATDESKKELAVLKRELKFLHEVAAPGGVQMYLFEPDKSRMIQMLGTPGPETKHVITYIPGTYTSVDSFYKRDTEILPAAIQQGHESDTVVFIWKDGQFPGEDDKTGDASASRIVEANDDKRGMEAGKRIAKFQTTINTADPVLASAIRAGIGFSWGLGGLTCSETAGAHYDTVISASGAGMPPGWKANPKTKYYDFSHFDILQSAQRAGVVWHGNNPRSNRAFHHGPYYAVSEPLDPKDTAHRINQLRARHDLTATNLPDNRPLINDVKQKVYGK